MNLAPLRPWIDHYRTRLRDAGLAESTWRWKLLHRNGTAPPHSFGDFLALAPQLSRDLVIGGTSWRAFAKLAAGERSDVDALVEAVLREGAPLTQCLEDFHTACRKLLAANGEDGYPTGKRERTLAAYLTLRDPARFTFYLDDARADVKRFSGYPVGDGYAGWTALVDGLAADLQADDAFAAAYRAALTPADYPDPSFRQVAADLLYTCTRRSPLGRIDPLQHVPFPSQIAKLSMSAKSVPDAAYRDARRRSVVLVHRDTKPLASSKVTQADAFAQAPRHSWFYLCRGNERVDLLGRFPDEDARPAADPELARAGWLERRYRRIGYPSTYAPYEGPQKWWTPNHNSTFALVPPHDYAEADRLLFGPLFGRALSPSLTHGRPQAPSWIPFYRALATRLLDFRDDRAALLEHLAEVQRETELLNLDNDRRADGTVAPVEDVDPFTVFAQFNRGLTDANRTTIAAALARALGIEVEAPTDFSGIPRANNQSTWFFAYAKTRGDGDIDALWQVFAKALALADEGADNEAAEEALAAAFDAALGVRQVGWNLTMGLFWIRPSDFYSLDANTRSYVERRLGAAVPTDGPGGRISGTAYLALWRELQERFAEADAPVHTFPELVAAAGEDGDEKGSQAPFAAPNSAVIHPLNQVLYGPPGTGKTYRTRQIACEICDGRSFKKREDVRTRYAELVEEGRVAFATFHPSLSYEDFVEGIKPRTDGDGHVSYEIEDGIFKRLSRLAQTPNGSSLEGAIKGLQQRLEDGEPRTFKVRGTEFELALNGAGNLDHYSLPKRGRRSILWDRIRERAVNPQPHFHQTFQRRILDLLEQAFGYTPNAPGCLQPHVLIVDELNRGNTPAIFGELITLLEPDKRLGAAEALTVTLPYSKTTFAVPANLYVVATMNTADRSVEALDAALRRRFAFTEVGPDPDVLARAGASGAVDGTVALDDGRELYLPDFLTLLNARLTALRDRDHALGHAPFLSADTPRALCQVLAKAVLPLLREYFFGDDAQLALVLGEGFCRPLPAGGVAFAPNDADEPDLPRRYEVLDPLAEDFDLADALERGGFLPARDTPAP